MTAATALLLAGAAQLHGQGGQTPLTVLSRDGRRTIPIALVNSREFVALDDLAATFQLTVREESGAITVSYKGRTIVLTPDQALASVAGRLISLPARPARIGARWLVPVEFISRVLAPFYDVRLDLRTNTHLVVIGDLRIPRVTIRYDPIGNAGRLTFDATPQTPSVVLQEGNRLVIRYEADALDALAPALTGQGPVPLVQAVRLDAATLSIDLGPRFAGFRASREEVGSSSRVTIELASTQPETAAAPPPPPLPPAPPELPTFGSPPSIRTVVLDPGHGGEDEGVKGSEGTIEKDLTLLVARRARSVLENRLGIRVLLTRDDDRNIPLEERTAMANNNKADVFVSLHANGSLKPTARGASIYVAAFSDSDKAQAPLAPARVPIFGGGVRDIELVPWDFAQIRHVDQSTELAHFVEREFQNRVPLDSRPVDRAPFRVLESANMPAVLIEVGYLTNGDEERHLASPEFQIAFVQALSDAVARFRDFLAGIGGDR